MYLKWPHKKEPDIKLCDHQGKYIPHINTFKTKLLIIDSSWVSAMPSPSSKKILKDMMLIVNGQLIGLVRM